MTLLSVPVPMIQPSPIDSRSQLIDDLLLRQDEVIRDLDELDVRLLAAIEESRPADSEQESAEEPADASATEADQQQSRPKAA